MTNRLLILIVLSCTSGLFSCATRPKNDYPANRAPKAPDYSLSDSWAALPDRKDMADSLASPDWRDVQADSEVDVFFIHPTTYTNKRGFNQWNGPVNDPRLNKRTDETTILYQASIFNGVGRVFAPRYRQAHLFAYFTKKDTAAARQAFEIAYQDVRSAFEYYLEHYNKGRPIILASHSQGTTHGIRLVKELFDGMALQKQLVAAYLVGIPVLRDNFKEIPLCQSPEQTGCFCTWRTFKEDFEPKNRPMSPEIAVTNPLSWRTDSDLIPKSANRGGVLRYFNQILPEASNAQIYNGILWASKPKFPGSIFFTRRNYHIADFNLYYVNVRENAQLRAKIFRERYKNLDVR